jgi:ferritin
MLKEKMQDAISEQINAEIYSSYLYLSMSGYFASLNLDGFANWMRIQAQEELVHATMFFDFVHDRGGRMTPKPIAAPPKDWDSPLAAFEQALRHEGEVTERINKLVDLARELSDHATHQRLQWFVGEQVEEEKNAEAVVQKLKLVGKDGSGLFMVDRELATRVFTMPAAAGGPGAAAG